MHARASTINPPTQVYYNHHRASSSDSNSYISTPRHSHFGSESTEAPRERNQERYREQYYVSHNTDDNNSHEDHLPEGTISVRSLNGTVVALFGLCLFDSGSTSTLINERTVPPQVKPKQGEKQLVTTTQGNYTSENYFDELDIMFPEFCKTRLIPTVHLRTFSSRNSRYDFIVGRDILKYGFVLDHAHSRIIWDGLSIPMTKHTSKSPSPTAVTHFSCMHMFSENYAAGTSKIKEAKYDSISPQEVAAQSSHLTSQEQQQLCKLLQQFPTLFSGQLGRYNKSQFKLELVDPYTTPIFCKPYPVAQTHMQVFLKELHHLVDKGVLEHIPCSE